MSQASQPRKLSLAAQIFIALVLAVIAGLLLQSHADFAATYIKPFGTIFLNLVKFIVGPIVLFSIMAGVVSMRDIKKSDRSAASQLFIISAPLQLRLPSAWFLQTCSRVPSRFSRPPA